MIATLLSAGTVAACMGTISDPGGGSATMGTASGSSGASSSGGGGDSLSGSAVPISVTGPAIAESAGTLVMRRLTYREYDHIVAELLGDTTSPASGANPWSPDAPANTGFVSPNSVSSYHVVEYNQTADALVDAAVQALAAGQNTGKFVLPAGCTAPSDTQVTGCATQFITTFGLHAYRRPVSTDEQTDLLTLFSTVRKDDSFSFIDSIGAVTKAMLQSPNFLYHWELGPTKPVKGADGLIPLSQWQTASRLATSLWESMPDDTLLTAAQAGQLATPAQIVAQAQRMIADPRAAQSLYSFHLQWLFNMGFHVTDLGTISAKDNSLLTTAAAQGLQTEFTQFISSVYAPPGDGTLNTLYTAPYAFVNKDLAAIYGVAGPDSGFAKVSLDPTQRAGIFTQVAFLAGIQDTIADNPVYRGLAIYTKALCGTMGAPPANVPGVNFTPGGTTRQAYDAHGSSACARACHSVFDPPGFAFENYDGIGQYRTTDNSLPVDASVTLTLDGASQTVADARGLLGLLATSDETQACFTRQWFRYALGRLDSTDDASSVNTAGRTFKTATGDIRELVVGLSTSRTFRYRTPATGEVLQ